MSVLTTLVFWAGNLYHGNGLRGPRLAGESAGLSDDEGLRILALSVGVRSDAEGLRISSLSVGVRRCFQLKDGVPSEECLRILGRRSPDNGAKGIALWYSVYS